MGDWCAGVTTTARAPLALSRYVQAELVDRHGNHVDSRCPGALRLSLTARSP